MIITMVDTIIDIGEDVDGGCDWAYYGVLIPLMTFNIIFYVMVFMDITNNWQTLLDKKIEF